jgi:NADP-dependent 3-hydroxy acid dehydrogenase YdfG
MDIADKVVLITGASSGIGAATARLAAGAGARVVLAARRADRITALAEDLPHAVPVVTDVTDPTQVEAAVQAGVSAFGRIDVLINNAGQGLHLPLEQVAVDDFRAVLELNVVAPLVAMQTVVPVMRAQGGGCIINVSSGTSRMVLPGAGAYAATKSALNMLSAVARRELAEAGIAVSTVYPFITDTEFHRTLRAGHLGSRPGGPPPHAPETVADAILKLIASGEEEAVLLPGGPQGAR